MEETNKNELYQSHGDHIDGIMDADKFAKEHLQQVINQSIVWQKSHTRYSSDMMDDELTDVVSLHYGTSDIAILTTIVCNHKGSANEIASIYPVMKGRTYRVKIERVIEWDDCIEATIFCSIGDFNFAFFAIDYYLNKHYYAEGQELDIDFSALGIKVRPGQQGFDIMGQQAIQFKANIGEDPEYDENGDVKPIHVGMTQLVAYLNTDEKAPDEAEFQSPITNIADVSILGVDLHKGDITIYRQELDEGDLMVSVPLYFRKDFLETVEDGNPISGWLWMTGAIHNKHEKLDDHIGEQNSLGKMCRDFENFMSGCDFKYFKNLTPVANQLNLLEIKEGYELDAFQCGDRHGSRFHIYCCKKNSTDRYKPTQKGLVPELVVVKKILGIFKKKEVRKVEKDVHIVYNDSQYIYGLLSWDEAQDVPSPLPYFKVPFTREGIMQAWLLNCIPDFMPLFWHAGYGAKDYIFSKEALSKIFQHSDNKISPFSDKRMSVREQVLKIDVDSLLPDVILKGDSATLKIAYWNDWNGLVLLTVDVIKDGSSVRFSEPKREILVKYNCGIRY